MADQEFHALARLHRADAAGARGDRAHAVLVAEVPREHLDARAFGRELGGGVGEGLGAQVHEQQRTALHESPRTGEAHAARGAGDDDRAAHGTTSAVVRESASSARTRLGSSACICPGRSYQKDQEAP
jgi:hypothetical protein